MQASLNSIRTKYFNANATKVSAKIIIFHITAFENVKEIPFCNSSGRENDSNKHYYYETQYSLNHMNQIYFYRSNSYY